MSGKKPKKNQEVKRVSDEYRATGLVTKEGDRFFHRPNQEPPIGMPIYEKWGDRYWAYFFLAGNGKFCQIQERRATDQYRRAKQEYEPVPVGLCITKKEKKLNRAIPGEGEMQVQKIDNSESAEKGRKRKRAESLEKEEVASIPPLEPSPLNQISSSFNLAALHNAALEQIKKDMLGQSDASASEQAAEDMETQTSVSSSATINTIDTKQNDERKLEESKYINTGHVTGEQHRFLRQPDVQPPIGRPIYVKSKRRYWEYFFLADNGKFCRIQQCRNVLYRPNTTPNMFASRSLVAASNSGQQTVQVVSTTGATLGFISPMPDTSSNQQLLDHTQQHNNVRPNSSSFFSESNQAGVGFSLPPRGDQSVKQPSDNADDVGRYFNWDNLGSR